MKFLIIIIFTVFSRSLCDARNNLVCQLFDRSTKTVEKYCKWYVGALPKNCLVRVPFILPSINEDHQVIHMKIGGCNSSTILDTMKMYRNIEWLDLSFSGYETLEWFDVKNERLKKLNVSFNLLSEVPWYLFQNVPEIVELDLSHMKITHLNETDLRDAKKLQKIHLSHNFLEQINGTYFASAANLEYIDVRANYLPDIPIFSSSKNLKVVHLEENPIRQFNCSFLLASRSTSYHLSWSNILSFNGDQNCAEKRIHIVSRNNGGGNGDGVSTAVKTGQYTLSCKSKSFTSLNNFVAGRNSFENVARILNCLTDIHYVDLAGNVIGELPANALKSFYFLERLNLSDTSLMYFDVGTLQSPSQLKSLDLSHNNLRDVRNISLAIYLNELNLTGNYLQNTPEIVQNLAATIQKLDLSGNFMGTVTPITFRRFLALHSLSLSNTSLSMAQSDPFERLFELRTLDISYNNLTNVNFTQFAKTLNRLVEFRAVNCHIENFTEILENLSSHCRILDLSGNLVGHLDERYIQNLTLLEELRIKNTGLTHFDAGALQNLKNLSTLDISFNALKVIDVSLLPKTLKHLNLQANELRRSDGLKRAEFGNLNTLAISNNQLECDQLKEIISDTKGIRFIDNPLNQKQQQDCDSNGNKIIIIVLIILVILIIGVCILCLIIRMRLVKPLRTVYSEK